MTINLQLVRRNIQSQNVNKIGHGPIDTHQSILNKSQYSQRPSPLLPTSKQINATQRRLASNLFSSNHDFFQRDPISSLLNLGNLFCQVYLFFVKFESLKCRRRRRTTTTTTIYVCNSRSRYLILSKLVDRCPSSLSISLMSNREPNLGILLTSVERKVNVLCP